VAQTKPTTSQNMRHALLKKRTETTAIPLDKLKANLAHVPEGKVPVVLVSTGYCPPPLQLERLQAWGLTKKRTCTGRMRQYTACTSRCLKRPSAGTAPWRVCLALGACR
jgi:hypothetical protein